jgi:hypothetical protein
VTPDTLASNAPEDEIATARIDDITRALHAEQADYRSRCVGNLTAIAIALAAHYPSSLRNKNTA